ncbi:MAG: hypothetical protein ACYTHJ_13575 [Planctomycetota bacterium]|jgi:hypothetical protein
MPLDRGHYMRRQAIKPTGNQTRRAGMSSEHMIRRTRTSASSQGIDLPRVSRLLALICLLITGSSAMPAKAAPPVNGVTQVIRVEGKGLPPKKYQGNRARMMARRAAEVVAVRNLARHLGLRSPARLRGFKYRQPVYHKDGSVTVSVEYRVRR